jgi:hypothetical protein
MTTINPLALMAIIISDAVQTHIECDTMLHALRRIWVRERGVVVSMPVEPS